MTQLTARRPMRRRGYSPRLGAGIRAFSRVCAIQHSMPHHFCLLPHHPHPLDMRGADHSFTASTRRAPHPSATRGGARCCRRGASQAARCSGRARAWGRGGRHGATRVGAVPIPPVACLVGRLGAGPSLSVALHHRAPPHCYWREGWRGQRGASCPGASRRGARRTTASPVEPTCRAPRRPPPPPPPPRRTQRASTARLACAREAAHAALARAAFAPRLAACPTGRVARGSTARPTRAPRRSCRTARRGGVPYPPRASCSAERGWT